MGWRLLLLLFIPSQTGNSSFDFANRFNIVIDIVD